MQNSTSSNNMATPASPTRSSQTGVRSVPAPAAKPVNASAESNVAPANDNAWMENIRTQAEEMENSVHSFIKSRPMLAVAAALGVGFLGSLLMNQFNPNEKSAGKSHKELS